MIPADVKHSQSASVWVEVGGWCELPPVFLEMWGGNNSLNLKKKKKIPKFVWRGGWKNVPVSTTNSLWLGRKYPQILSGTECSDGFNASFTWCCLNTDWWLSLPADTWEKLQVVVCVMTWCITKHSHICIYIYLIYHWQGMSLTQRHISFLERLDRISWLHSTNRVWFKWI